LVSCRALRTMNERVIGLDVAQGDDAGVADDRRDVGGRELFRVSSKEPPSIPSPRDQPSFSSVKTNERGPESLRLAGFTARTRGRKGALSARLAAWARKRSLRKGEDLTAGS